MSIKSKNKDTISRVIRQRETAFIQEQILKPAAHRIHQLQGIPELAINLEPPYFTNLQNSKLHTENWGWYSKKDGVYQFGKIIFQQKGKTRKKVFIILMDLFELSPDGMSVKSMEQRSGFERKRIRIEINAINKRLSSKQISYFFKGSGQGFYTLEKFPDQLI